MAVFLPSICASVSLSVRTEPSCGCWNTTAQHSWPGTFSNCIYLPAFLSGYLCSNPWGRGKRLGRLLVLTKHRTHVWHSTVFGSSGAALTSQQEISVKPACQCVCSQAKCRMPLCQGWPQQPWPRDREVTLHVSLLLFSFGKILRCVFYFHPGRSGYPLQCNLCDWHKHPDLSGVTAILQQWEGNQNQPKGHGCCSALT